MAEDPPSEEVIRAALRLRLLAFYLPRLLACKGHPLQEQWVYAQSLQQIGAAVLSPPYDEPSQMMPAAYEVARRRLNRLGARLHEQLRQPPDRGDLRQEAARWKLTLLLLRLTMPLVEHRLREILGTAPPSVWTVSGLAWLMGPQPDE